MGKQNLPPNYHRDWQRRRAEKDPEWYEARNRRRTEARRQRKRRIVELFGGKCMDCHGIYPPEVYDFHHPDPSTKRKTKHRSAGYALFGSERNAMKALRGCLLLCANCHRIRHAVPLI